MRIEPSNFESDFAGIFLLSFTQSRGSLFPVVYLNAVVVLILVHPSYHILKKVSVHPPRRSNTFKAIARHEQPKLQTTGVTQKALKLSSYVRTTSHKHFGVLLELDRTEHLYKTIAPPYAWNSVHFQAWAKPLVPSHTVIHLPHTITSALWSSHAALLSSPPQRPLPLPLSTLSSTPILYAPPPPTPSSESPTHLSSTAKATGFTNCYVGLFSNCFVSANYDDSHSTFCTFKLEIACTAPRLPNIIWAMYKVKPKN